MKDIIAAFKDAWGMIRRGERPPKQTWAQFHEGWDAFPFWEKVLWISVFGIGIAVLITEIMFLAGVF